jgi:hypothetical protein
MPAETTGVLEQAAVEAFAERVLGDYAGANAFFMAGIGDRLGLFKELAANGAATSDELATRTRLQERYVREWLGGMAAAGYLDYDPATGRYALPADHVPVLAEEAGPFFFGSAFFDFSTNFGQTYRRLVDAFATAAACGRASTALKWRSRSNGSPRPGSSTCSCSSGCR